MIILGIDPGTARVGWAVLRSEHIEKRTTVFGCLETDKKDSPEKRLRSVYEGILSLIDTHHPDCAAIEELFFSTNAKTAIAVGQARGVILLACAMRTLPVSSYTPLTVKQTICGYGKAEKSQIQNMVKQILKLDQVPKPDDAADALAIALTHAYSYKIKHITV